MWLGLKLAPAPSKRNSGYLSIDISGIFFLHPSLRSDWMQSSLKKTSSHHYQLPVGLWGLSPPERRLWGWLWSALGWMMEVFLTEQGISIWIYEEENMEHLAQALELEWPVQWVQDSVQPDSIIITFWGTTLTSLIRYQKPYMREFTCPWAGAAPNFRPGNPGLPLPFWRSICRKGFYWGITIDFIFLWFTW